MSADSITVTGTDVVRHTSRSSISVRISRSQSFSYFVDVIGNLKEIWDEVAGGIVQVSRRWGPAACGRSQLPLFFFTRFSALSLHGCPPSSVISTFANVRLIWIAWLTITSLSMSRLEGE